VNSHFQPVFVNLSLLVSAALPVSAAASDEQAITSETGAITGRLERNDEAGFVFRAPGQAAVPLREVRRVVRLAASPAPMRGSPAHRVTFWGDESLSGTVESLDGAVVILDTPAGERLRIPRYLVAKIEHFVGDAVIVHDDFENADASRRITGEPQRTSKQAVSGQASLSLNKPGDTIEYALADPIGRGWIELRFWDSGQPVAGFEWVCELTFDSRSGPRVVQVFLAWDADSYGLATPDGPALPVQRLARRRGWRRFAAQLAPDRVTMLIDDGVLAHGQAALGRLRSLRLALRSTDEAAARLDGVDAAAFVDDVQIAASVAAATEWFPAQRQDDVLLVTGDQVFGQIQSASREEVVIRADFGSYATPWRRLQELHFASQPCPVRELAGQRVRIEFAPAGSASPRGEPNDVLVGVLADLDDASIHLKHPHLGAVRVPRDQMREMEVQEAGQWVAIDSGFHHLGDVVNVGLQAPFPTGTDRSWRFTLERVPTRASLVLHVVQMESLAAGAAFAKRLEDDEYRTYASVNDQPVDPRGLNHVVPLKTRGAVRLVLPLPPEMLRAGENTLRIHQTPQRSDPPTFDDCGVFGISVVLDKQ
jgi:hypothetical protein